MRLARILAAAAIVLVVPSPARAEAPEPSSAITEGRTHFNRGVEFFREADYRAALVEFERAYEVAPNYRILYNLGQTYFELQDYAGALQSFEKYVAQGGSELPAARRTAVESDIERLKPRVAKLEVTTSTAGAEITIDDVPIGKTPLAEPVLVSTGRRKVGASLAGHVPTTRLVDLAGGDHTKIALDLVPLNVASPPPDAHPQPIADTPQPRTDAQAPSRAPLYVGIGATAALAVATGVIGGLTLSANHDFTATLGRFPVASGDVDSARSKVHTLALVTDIALACTVVAGGITAYIALRPGSAKTAVRMGVTPRSVSLEAAF